MPAPSPVAAHLEYACGMRLPFPCIVASIFLCALAMPQSAFAHVPEDEVPVTETVIAERLIVEVTLYQGRAMVARTSDAPAREGTMEVRFEGLPATLEPDSLQATVLAPQGGAKLLDVRYEEKVTAATVTNNPELRAAIDALEAATRVAERHGMEMTAITDRHAFLAAIRQKTATETAKELGTRELVPEALRAQIEFLDQEQARLIEDRVKLDAAVRANTAAVNALQAKVQSLGGVTKTERAAVVTVGKSSATPAQVTLRYLVRDAGWAPRYAIRADLEARALTIEYDAEIRQASGEDWNDVRLVLSTAQPTQRATPWSIAPVFVDLYVPEPPMAPGSPAPTLAEWEGARQGDSKMPGRPSGGLFDRKPAGMDADRAGAASEVNLGLKLLYEDAAAARTGTVVTYPMARATTIPSDAARSRKLRIATIETKPTFVHVARPLVESAVYLKAVAANASNYQFLAGPATVFLGADSVGSTALGDLAPGAEMTFWLGTDRRLQAKRVLVKKDSSEKGVFGKSDVTRWDYRIDLASTEPAPVLMEVLDRVPVSRDEQIQVDFVCEVTQGGAPLATDASYVADEKPQGLLKWLVEIPAATVAGKPATKSIAWSVTVTKPKGAQTTSFPD